MPKAISKLGSCEDDGKLKDQAIKTGIFLAACLLGYIFAKEKAQSVTPADLEEGQPTNISPKQFKEGIGIQNGGNRSWIDCH